MKDEKDASIETLALMIAELVAALHEIATSYFSDNGEPVTPSDLRAMAHEALLRMATE